MATDQDQRAQDEQLEGDTITNSEGTDTADESVPPVPLPATFRLPKLSYFSVGFTLFAVWIVAGASVAYLGWLFVLPVLQIAWMLRLKTVITETGLTAVSTFRRRDVTWDQITGLQFRKWGAVRAVLVDKTEVKLPAITFRDMPLLSSASRGRIPDPYAAAREAIEKRDASGDDA
ncbi:PH domain-containing protein [Jongsikchunia kroppenstedtii]|uniref:PH domain-containing protein n=1 Tax=Jongsikchunia kroppenstedtii TaxID=1121721 RepID=UPI00037778EE|nr:PH domain-containing protein [Jongsikchunia kroppenstedtii]